MKDSEGEELARQRTTRLEARIEELERQLATYQSPLSHPNFYEKVLDDLPIQLAVLDTTLRYCYVNALSIADPETRRWIIGKTDLEYCHKRGFPLEIAHQRQAWYRQVIASKQTSRFEETLQTHAGETRHLVRVAKPILDAEGAVTHFVGYGLDITEQKLAEAETQRLKGFYQDILDQLPLQIAIFDTEGRFLYVNPAGLSSPEMRQWVLGHTEADFMKETGRDPALAEQRMAHLFRVVAERTDVSYIEAFPASSGETRSIIQSYYPILDHNGEISRVIGHRHDITPFKQAEREREQLIEELEAKNAELERFTYTVSHDLKSPLVTIKGFLGLLEQDALQGNIEQFRNDIAHLNTAADRMYQLLADLLELSRIGRLVNPSVAVSLTDLARETCDLIAGDIAAHSVEVVIEPGMPSVYADQLRLLEVYQNLIGNAVKYMGDQQTPRVEVGARQENDEILCFVRDNGMGIAPRYLEKIFGLFERLDPSVEGTGIGLALVKRIIEVHGGRVWAESEEPGQGSTFYFTLPLPPSG